MNHHPRGGSDLKVNGKGHAKVFCTGKANLWAVATKPFGCHLKLVSREAEAHKSKNPENKADRLGADTLHGSHIDRLGVVTKPVAEVDAFDVHLGKFATAT